MDQIDSAVGGMGDVQEPVIIHLINWLIGVILVSVVLYIYQVSVCIHLCNENYLYENYSLLWHYEIYLSVISGIAGLCFPHSYNYRQYKSYMHRPFSESKLTWNRSPVHILYMAGLESHLFNYDHLYILLHWFLIIILNYINVMAGWLAYTHTL